MGDIGFILLVGLLVIMMIIVSSGMKVIKEGEKAIIERLGVYDRELSLGMHFIIPFIERIAFKTSIGEQMSTPNKSTIITKDDKELILEYMVHYIISDIKLFHYGVNKVIININEFALKTLKKEILKINYEDLGIELNNIEANIKEDLADIVMSWGITITKIAIEKKIK